MKTMNKVLKKLDLFGVSYTFKYKSQDKYKTSLGGIITVLFFIIFIIIAIYNFIPYYNKKNFTTIYYTLKLAETEQIDFYKSQMVFSIGLNCREGSDGTKAEDLFDVQHKYIYWDVQNGEYSRRTDQIATHPCTYSDFYNKFNKAFDDSKLYNYQCLDDLSKTIEGIYASPVFSYYEFDVNAKNDSRELLDKIEAYLFENDCKLQIYYIDNTVDIDDYKNPIQGFIEAVFIQLNPTLSTRRNIYFMNQHLFDNDEFLSLFYTQEKEANQLFSLYSRYEEYSLFQGLNRTNKSSDYLSWVKLFFRADTRKTYVKRNYQNFLEFYADTTSLLFGIFQILIIIFDFINTFYAELSLSKKIFFFKELKYNHFDLKKYSNKINELIHIKQSSDVLSIQIEDNNNNTRPYNHPLIAFTPIHKKKNSKRTPITGLDNLNTKKMDLISDSNEYSINKLRINKLPTYLLSAKNNHKLNNNNEFMENIKKDKNKDISSMHEYGNIKYDFNICEIIFSYICKRCVKKNLELKSNLNEKATDILDMYLDIVTFVKNNILLNLINELMLDDNMHSIINFICHPIISINTDNNKYENNEFHRSFKDENFEKFSNEFKRLSKRANKKAKENKLLLLSEKHLKDLWIKAPN